MGGGFAGLSAALFFKQRASPARTCLILDNAKVFGGVAKRNEFVVNGHRLYAPQASVHFQPPYPNSFLKSVYDAMGLDWSAFQSYQTWQGSTPDLSLPRSPYRACGYEDRKTYAWFFGAKFGHKPGIWVKDPWSNNLASTPFSEQTRREMLAWRHGQLAAPRLVYDYPGDAISRQLDGMTLEELMMRTYGMSRETVRTFFVADTAGGFGVGPDALSGYLEYMWSREIPTVDDSMETGLQMFPGGNSGMTRLIVKTLIPESIEGSSHDGGSLEEPHSLRGAGSARAANPPASEFHRGSRGARCRARQVEFRLGHLPIGWQALSSKGEDRGHGGRRLDDEACCP